MITYCKENLLEIKKLIVSIKNEQYTYRSHLLTDATIGQHIRHILEFYICLINSKNSGFVNYDKRERDLELETNPAKAIYTIDKICSNLTFPGSNNEMILEGNYSTSDTEATTIKTSANRELAYCLEHSIHHQALIKIGLIDQKIESLINKSFGVAPATIRYKEKCAQ